MSNADSAPSSRLRGKRSSTFSMTEGSIVRHLITFAFPLFIGDIFQLLYNMVDAWVVGNYVSDEAYAAVGTLGNIMALLISFFSGMAAGAGVIISQYFGAKDEQSVSKAVHTSILMTLAMGVFITIVSLFSIPYMLHLINMPEHIKPEATVYLQIYYLGVLGLVFYNIGSGILRAVGDSRHPFYYLVIASVLNVVLDLVFVLVFHMGVAGVALATVLCQMISAILVLLTLVRSESCVKLRWKLLKVDWSILRRIFFLGLPSALQMSLNNFSNIFAMSYINFFGADVMGGWTSYGRFEQLASLPSQAFNVAITTFVGQNIGAGQPDRASKGLKQCMILSVSITVLLSIPLMIFSRDVVTFFNSKPEVVAYGSAFLLLMTPPNVFTVINNVYFGGLRGSGNTRIPMLIAIANSIVLRHIYLFIVRHVCNSLYLVIFAFPLTWFTITLCLFIYYRRHPFSRSAIE